MSGISPVNIQHIVQMGTATEKLQHTLQNIPQAHGQHQNEERKIADEAKRSSVQDPELSNESNSVNPEGSKGNQSRKDNEDNPSDLDAEEEAYKKKVIALEAFQGKTIDVVI
ncbi:MAG: hypothetical protein NPINA01_12390 [Nitrospinaceae bacterium]|nr:MAG: hypothetical protein NPINA01_12390 [Nitrospinaceae bacterium]